MSKKISLTASLKRRKIKLTPEEKMVAYDFEIKLIERKLDMGSPRRDVLVVRRDKLVRRRNNLWWQIFDEKKSSFAYREGEKK